MRVLMTGGGTGGHVNPAIAIAETIKQNIPGSEIAFVGTERGIENKLVKAAGYDIYHVKIQGFRRSLSLYNVKTAFLAAVSPVRAKKIIKEFRPDIVIGTGGYVSWPLLVAASKMGVPCAVHESNALAGMTVRKLQRYVDRIWINFASTAAQLTEAPDKVMHVGNPLRPGFSAVDRSAARKSLGIDGKYDSFVLSYGGSLGAQMLNEAVLDMMSSYGREHPRTLFLHASGAIERDAAKAMFAEYGLAAFDNLKLVEYIYDMPVQMAAADVVICRAGAMTVSELSMQKKTAVLIPSPNVVDNHQYKNAKVLADAGAAVLVEEKELINGRLANEVDMLLNDMERRAKMGSAIAGFTEKDTNKLIFDDIIKLTSAKSKK